MKDIDQYLHTFLRSKEFRILLNTKKEEIATDHAVTMTYALERLIITHVKLFMLEDEVREEGLSDDELGKTKRKIDYWNGIVRPRLVAALGDMMVEAVLGKDENVIKEPNLKDYKAR